MSDAAKKKVRRMVGRAGDAYDANCPTRVVLDHVTSRWGMLILIVLRERTHRFSELGRRIGGVSEKMLAQSLQVLEADGFVLRTVIPAVPPKVEYSLTAMGEEVAPHVEALTRWVEENVGTVMQVRKRKERAAGNRAKTEAA